jgi:hypothetical protein
MYISDKYTTISAARNTELLRNERSITETIHGLEGSVIM